MQLVSTGLETDHRGITVFTMPDGDAETIRLGTKDLSAFNPEGRVPILLLADGRMLTQSGAIIDYIESVTPTTESAHLVPTDPWQKAEMQRIMYIVAADVQPYQNIPFIIQAMGEWGMVKAAPDSASHAAAFHPPGVFCFGKNPGAKRRAFRGWG